MEQRQEVVRPEWRVNQDPWINPTLLIFLFCWLLCGLQAWLYFSELLPKVWSLTILFVVQTVNVFIAFTPAHEGVHRVAHRSKRINDLMMHSLWPIFMNSPYLFRRVHLLHHAHVNQGEKDPDHFTQAHSLFDRWLKSFFLLSNYFVYGLKFINRDWRDRVHLMLSPGIPILILMSLPFIPHAAYVFWAWVAPAYVGIGLLAYANTALPHQPGIEVDRFRNTRNLRMPWIMEKLMWHQNLHLVHHLQPTLPWYRYKAYFKANEDWLSAKGAETGVYSTRPLV